MTDWMFELSLGLLGSGIAAAWAWLIYRHLRATAFADRSASWGDYRLGLTGWLAALLVPLLALAITLLLLGMALMMVLIAEGKMFGRVVGFTVFLGAAAYSARLTAKSAISSCELLFRSISREGDVIVTRSWLGVKRYPLVGVTEVKERDEDFEFVFADGRKLAVHKLIRGAAHLANAAARRAGLELFNPEASSDQMPGR